MSKLVFSDGVTIETSGNYRKLQLKDGWYVVGHGELIPAADEKEANEVLEDLLQPRRKGT